MRLTRITASVLVLVVLAPIAARAQDDDRRIEPPPIPSTPLPPADEPVKPAAPAEDPDAAAAREYERKAQELFDDRQFDEAIALWLRAETRRKDPAHDLGIARALAKKGKLLEARALYRKLASAEGPKGAPPGAADVRAAAEEGAKALDARLPKLAIVVRARAGAPVAVKLDGAVVDPAKPIDVDPGQHALDATAGRASVTRLVEAHEGATERVVVDLRPPPAFEARSLAPYAIGLGVFGLGLGGVTGGLSLAKVADIKSRCVAGHCPPEDLGNGDSARMLGTISTVGLVAGGVLAATGVVLALLPSSKDDGRDAPARAPRRAALSMGVGPGSVLVGGAF